VSNSRIPDEVNKILQMEASLRQSGANFKTVDSQRSTNSRPVTNKILIQRIDRFSKSMLEYMIVNLFVELEPIIIDLSQLQIEHKYLLITHGFFVRFVQPDRQLVVVDVEDIHSVYAATDAIDYIKKQYSREVRMKTWNEHQQLIIQDLKRLQPLSMSEPNVNTNVTETHVITTLNAIIEDLKKTNRLTVKGFIDLKASLDEMDTLLKGNTDDSPRLKQAEKEIVLKTKLLFEVFDVIDLAYDAATRMNDATTRELLEQCVLKTLSLLKEIGIEELPVLHEKIDGETMESIGTVSMSDTDGQVPQYHVYKVHARAFVSTHDKKLLRRAKIISVL
jgi:hypothetical protein